MTKTTKRVNRDSRLQINLTPHPSGGQQPRAFRKKGSSFKTGNSHSRITAAEQAAAYRGIDNNPEQEDV